MSQRTFLQGQRPVPPEEIEITGIGLNPLDRRRVDLAVDLTPFLEPVRVEVVIVAPDDEEVCSMTVVHNRDWMIDKMLHLKREAGTGEHVLHVGVFYQDDLVAHAARRFLFPPDQAS